MWIYEHTDCVGVVGVSEYSFGVMGWVQLYRHSLYDDVDNACMWLVFDFSSHHLNNKLYVGLICLMYKNIQKLHWAELNGVL